MQDEPLLIDQIGGRCGLIAHLHQVAPRRRPHQVKVKGEVHGTELG